MTVRLRTAAILFLSVVATSTACANSADDPASVQQAILASGVVGQLPAEAERRLQAIVLPGGRRLDVGTFDEKRLVIEASVRDAQGRPGKDWNMNALIRFDSAHRATTVEAHKSAVSPF